MPRYRCLLLDENHRVQGVVVFELSDQFAAVAHARACLISFGSWPHSEKFEVWGDAGRVFPSEQ